MEVYVGIDWSENKHDVAIVNTAGKLLIQFSISHTPDGFAEIIDRSHRLGLVPEHTVVVWKQPTICWSISSGLVALPRCMWSHPVW